MRNKPECSYGFDLCSDEVAVCLDEITVFLQEQLQKERYWVVSEGFLAELATMIYEIWEIRTLEDMKLKYIVEYVRGTVQLLMPAHERIYFVEIIVW